MVPAHSWALYQAFHLSFNVWLCPHEPGHGVEAGQAPRGSQAGAVGGGVLAAGQGQKFPVPSVSINALGL